MCSNSNFRQIAARIGQEDEDIEKKNEQFFSDATDQRIMDEYYENPTKVPESMLPSLKAKYLCYTVCATKEMYEKLIENTTPQTMHLDCSV